MTTPPAAIPQVTPVPGSRLEQLLSMREGAHAAVTEAKQRAEAIEAGIKAEVAAPWPGQTVIDIAGAPGRAALRLRWHPGSWHVPAETLRSKHADVWDELKKQKRGSWQLHELNGSGT